MSNNTITLFCLVDGATTAHAFPVKIPPSDTISDLKELIKTAKTPSFNDVDANLLMLWRVDHRFIAANMDNPVPLSSINPRTELAPFFRISDIFPEPLPDMTTHIIVQRPPPPATLTKQKFVSSLKRVGHHRCNGCSS